MQRVKNTRPCCTSVLIHGRMGLVIVSARKDKERFQSLA